MASSVTEEPSTSSARIPASSCIFSTEACILQAMESYAMNLISGACWFTALQVLFTFISIVLESETPADLNRTVAEVSFHKRLASFTGIFTVNGWLLPSVMRAKLSEV